MTWEKLITIITLIIMIIAVIFLETCSTANAPAIDYGSITCLDGGLEWRKKCSARPCYCPR